MFVVSDNPSLRLPKEEAITHQTTRQNLNSVFTKQTITDKIVKLLLLLKESLYQSCIDAAEQSKDRQVQNKLLQTDI